jgi:hypothetical protein
MANSKLARKVAAIQESGKTIYDPVTIGSSQWLPIDFLETLLELGLRGTSLAGLPLRTRSKVVKARVCASPRLPATQCVQKDTPEVSRPGFRCLHPEIQQLAGMER